MKIQVRYFAVVRERLGRDEETLEVAPGASVGDALALLAERHGVLAPLRKYLQVAVNQETVPADHALADGDELALIPPVAGGARLARVVGEEQPSLDRVVAGVRGPSIGGVAAFVGLVREQSQGHQVTSLEYEAYAAMAERVFNQICDEIEARYPGARLAVEHRVGRLAVGDVAVALAAGAPHRAEAFAAARELIDELKRRAPIWKKETGPDGTEWVGMGP
jgi:molybdopterin synthase catalytic subunit